MVPVELALVLEESAEMSAMMGGNWIDNSIAFSSTVVAWIPRGFQTANC